MKHTREERASRFFAGDHHVFNLLGTVSGLWEEADLTGSGRAGTTLVKTSDLRVVLQVLRIGAALAEHKAPGPITVQVLSGEIRFETGGEIIYMEAGDLLALPARQAHSVEAVRDAAFLLTIAPEERH